MIYCTFFLVEKRVKKTKTNSLCDYYHLYAVVCYKKIYIFITITTRLLPETTSVLLPL